MRGKVKKAFANKRFRYGAFSTLISILVIALIFGVNFVISFFNLQYDLTADKIYTISDESKKIINNLEEDITLYAFLKTGEEDYQYQALISQYAEAARVTVLYKDPFLYPTFANDYLTEEMDLPVGSIIVVGENKSRVIPADDLYTYEYDPATWQRYIKSFDLEPRVTNAIRYVTASEPAVIYQISNYNERELQGSLSLQISMENYEIKSLNLFESENIPEDADILLLTTPTRDYSPDDAAKVIFFLQNGGRALIFADITAEARPNFFSIMEAYDITVIGAPVAEASYANLYPVSPYHLLPNFSDHEITDNLPDNTYILLFPAFPISAMSVVRNSLVFEPLLSSSRMSYAKTGDLNSPNKEPEDIEGPFSLAVAITDTVYAPGMSAPIETKLVVAGSSSVLNDSLNEIVSGGNGDFVLNSLNWLNNADDTVYIRPKVVSDVAQLMMTAETARILSVGAMYVLPGAFLLAGIVITFRRRNR